MPQFSGIHLDRDAEAHTGILGQPLFLAEETSSLDLPTYTKDQFREQYEPICREKIRLRSSFRRWFLGIKNRLSMKPGMATIGKELDAVHTDKENGYDGIRFRKGKSTPKGLPALVPRRPVSTYDFKQSPAEKNNGDSQCVPRRNCTGINHSEPVKPYVVPKTFHAIPFSPSILPERLTQPIPSHTQHRLSKKSNQTEIARTIRWSQSYQHNALTFEQSAAGEIFSKPPRNSVAPAVLVHLRRKGQAAQDPILKYRQHDRLSTSGALRRLDYDLVDSFRQRPEMPEILKQISERAVAPVRPEWTTRLNCCVEESKGGHSLLQKKRGKRLEILDDKSVYELHQFRLSTIPAKSNLFRRSTCLGENVVWNGKENGHVSSDRFEDSFVRYGREVMI